MSVTSRLLLGLLLVLAGCAHTPEERQARQCAGCTRTEITLNSPFSPLIALTQASTSDSRLHVYLEGDGRPWSHWNSPSPNPNSVHLTALKLMQLDSGERVYLNRPCYGALPMPRHCRPIHWTEGRYSEPVVLAMSAALDQLRTRHGAQELVLIGHSGGGVLAMLLAQRRDDVAAVVTVAANLDHVAWTEHFGYLPLSLSLNAAAVDLSPQVVRWHLVGGQDQQVPPAITLKAASRDPQAITRLLPAFDHSCCWSDIWPAVLNELNLVLAPAPTAGP